MSQLIRIFLKEIYFSRNLHVIFKQSTRGHIDEHQQRTIKYLFRFIVPGLLSTTGMATTGFSISKFQPKKMKNPFIQYIMFAKLFGSDPDKKEHYRHAFNYDPKVRF